MEKSKRISRLAAGVLWLAVIGAGCFILPGNLPAAAPEAAQAVSFNVNTSMADNLAALKGKTITVTLSTGQAITGTVAEVKGNLLLLTRLSQKEFYDALIAIDRISAVEMRAR